MMDGMRTQTQFRQMDLPRNYGRSADCNTTRTEQMAGWTFSHREFAHSSRSSSPVSRLRAGLSDLESRNPASDRSLDWRPVAAPSRAESLSPRSSWHHSPSDPHLAPPCVTSPNVSSDSRFPSGSQPCTTSNSKARGSPHTQVCDNHSCASRLGVAAPPSLASTSEQSVVDVEGSFHKPDLARRNRFSRPETRHREYPLSYSPAARVWPVAAEATVRMVSRTPSSSSTESDSSDVYSTTSSRKYDVDDVESETGILSQRETAEGNGCKGRPRRSVADQAADGVRVLRERVQSLCGSLFGGGKASRQDSRLDGYETLVSEGANPSSFAAGAITDRVHDSQDHSTLFQRRSDKSQGKRRRLRSCLRSQTWRQRGLYSNPAAAKRHSSWVPLGRELSEAEKTRFEQTVQHFSGPAAGDEVPSGSSNSDKQTSENDVVAAATFPHANDAPSFSQQVINPAHWAHTPPDLMQLDQEAEKEQQQPYFGHLAAAAWEAHAQGRYNRRALKRRLDTCAGNSGHRPHEPAHAHAVDAWHRMLHVERRGREQLFHAAMRPGGAGHEPRPQQPQWQHSRERARTRLGAGMGARPAEVDIPFERFDMYNRRYSVWEEVAALAGLGGGAERGNIWLV